MKNSIKKHISPDFYQKLRYPLLVKRTILNHFYDARKFIKHSCLNYRPNDPSSYSAIITMEYHKLEKALTLPNPKKVYGEEISSRIIRIIKNNIDYAQSRPFDTDIAIKALEDYIVRAAEAHPPLGNKFTQILSKNVRELKRELGPDFPLSSGNAGVLPGAADLERTIDFLEFNRSRKSVRNFSEKKIPEELIYGAIDCAKHTPSVCNRQPWHIYYTDSKSKIIEALDFQNGSNGFKDKVPGLIIISSSIKYFPLSGERNQMWIDGGMFAMNLLLSLHACGLSACALNWGNDASVDKAAKSKIGLAEHEVIIMMIAIGYPSDNHLVCISNRRDTKSFLTNLS